MDKPDKDISRLSPDALLGDFTGGSLGKWFAIALLVHVLILGVTSFSTVLDLVDPSRVVAREAAAAAAAEAEAEAVLPPQVTAGDGETAGIDDAAQAGGDEAADGDASMSPVERRVTEAASLDELPDEPDAKISDEEFGL